MNSSENQSIKAEQDDDFVNKIAEYENYDIERTIEEILDVDTGEIILAADIFENKESFIISVRKTLELAHKSNIFKYLCPYCEQEVRISKRNVYSRNNTTYFFSHYPKSNDCPIKSENNKTLEELLKDRNNDTREGETHKELVSFISDSLTSEISKSKGFYDVYSYKFFKDTNIMEGWRRPDVTAMYGSKKMVFELQLNNTFLGNIVERDSFYRMHKTYILWTFGKFTTNNKKIVEKDLYYAHKRNVFVLDKMEFYKYEEFNEIRKTVNETYTTAQEESLKSGELLLNCFWQIPVFEENKKIKFKWENKLVSINELTFDEEKHEIYYYNSDKDFYEQEDPEKQKIIDDWELEKEKRWNKIFDNIELRRKRKEEWELNKDIREQKSLEKYKIINLIHKIQTGEIELISFKDENGLYGYRVTVPEQTEISKTIIKPKYSEALSFKNGIGFVKMANWGAISISGKKVIPFQYLSLNWIEDTEYIIATDKKKKVGVIDLNEKTIFPFEYDEIQDFINGKAIAKKNNKYGQIDEDGNEIIPFEYDEIRDFINGKAIAEKNSKYGQINELGHETIPFELDEISEFIDGKAIAKKNNKFGLIDINGNEITSFEYDEIRDFGNGKSILKKRKENTYIFVYGLVDETGNLIIPLICQEIAYEGNCLVKAKINDKYGLVDLNNNTVIPFIYQKISNFENGTAEAMKNGMYGYIDRSGNEITINKIEITNGIFKGEKFGLWGIEDSFEKNILPFEYSEIQYTVEGKLKVKQKGRYGYADINGSIVIPVIYETIYDFVGGKAKAKKGSYYGYINENGNEITPFFYQEIDDFVDGIAKARRNNIDGFIDEYGNEIIQNKIEITNGIFKGEKFGLWGLEDLNGRNIVPFEYTEIQNFLDNKLKVQKGGKYGYLDLEGNVIVPIIFQSIDEFEDNKAKARKNNFYGYIDIEGNEITKFEYNHIGLFVNGIARVNRGGMIGYIDQMGKEIIPIIYNEISSFVEGFAIAKIGDKYGIIDESGNTKIPFEIDYLKRTTNRLFITKQYGKCGCIDINQKIVIPFEYEDIKRVFNEMYVVGDNFNYGVVNLNGTVVVPFQYDDIVPMNGNYIGIKSEVFHLIKTSNLIAQKVACKITGISDFGVFLELSGIKGLLHINEIHRADMQIGTFFKGDFVDVYISAADEEKNRLSFSILPNNREAKTQSFEQKKIEINSVHVGVISKIENYGLFVKIRGIGTAMLHISELKKHRKNIFDYDINDEIEVKVLHFDNEKNRVSLTL